MDNQYARYREKMEGVPSHLTDYFNCMDDFKLDWKEDARTEKQKKLAFLQKILTNFKPDLSEYTEPTEVLKIDFFCGGPFTYMSNQPTQEDKEAHKAKYIHEQKMLYVKEQVIKHNAQMNISNEQVKPLATSITKLKAF